MHATGQNRSELFKKRKGKNDRVKRMVWPPQSPDLNPIEWFGMNWTEKVKQRFPKSSSHQSSRSIEMNLLLTKVLGIN